jgi:hypothetical protein
MATSRSSSPTTEKAKARSEFQHTYSGGETQCTHCRGWTRGANLLTECPTRLRAEVERLRELLLNAGWPREADGIAELALQAERAAVVAWLREQANSTTADVLRARDLDAADIIESGEHRREEDK